jgi:hypothetical protein
VSGNPDRVREVLAYADALNEVGLYPNLARRARVVVCHLLEGVISTPLEGEITDEDSAE